MSKIIDRIKKMKGWHIVLGIFLLGLFIFLSVRAADEFRWSDWGFGDAQSMLSLKQWDKAGWFSNYFLFIPQGYAKVIRLFDDPQLRQHAHGTCPGSSPRIGPRLWYTHYPAGYLIPYAVLFKLGLTDVFHARMLSIIFSVTALILMYIVFAKITNHGIAFFAVLFYSGSPAFLGYADTIANQPIDDLLRFAFMLLIVLSTRAESPAAAKKWMILAWLAEFCLSLSSFDSVFFIYVWLIGWDLIERKGFRWKIYLIYALAPVTAHSLQFLQNVWYLGFNDAFLDIKDTFMLKSGADKGYNFGQNRFSVIFETVHAIFNNIFSPALLILGLFLLYALYYLFLKGNEKRELPSLWLLFLLFVCGLTFVIVLPHGARMPYEARQMLPLVSLLISGFIWSLVKGFREGIHDTGSGKSLRLKLLLPYILVASVLVLFLGYRFFLLDRRPVYYIPDMDPAQVSGDSFHMANNPDLARGLRLKSELLFARELKSMPTRYEPVFFDIGGFQIFWDPNYVPGYPQIMPITEYYAGSKPILCFNAHESAARDIIYLMRKSPDRFSPVLIASNQVYIEDVLNILSDERMLINLPSSFYVVMDRYVLDLTDYLKWEVQWSR
ncbi:MAG: glycosyltransferase family 39 protein [Nitrospirae bacterium]|nr:glycosyltransferase family 39 protein [Nitrospirota bacterium]